MNPIARLFHVALLAGVVACEEAPPPVVDPVRSVITTEVEAQGDARHRVF